MGDYVIGEDVKERYEKLRRVRPSAERVCWGRSSKLPEVQFAHEVYNHF
jgi:hypothetical protein